MSVARLIIAANGSVPRNKFKPNNCHEAVLGWVLQAKYPQLCNVDRLSHGVEKAWHTLRAIVERYGVGVGAFKQLTGNWVARNIYQPAARRVREPFSHATFFLGDIAFFGNRNSPHHSMVVVQKNGIQALARGFNNAGGFGGPYMSWDPTLRDLTDPARWDGRDEIMCNNGRCELWMISYDLVCRQIPDNMTW